MRRVVAVMVVAGLFGAQPAVAVMSGTQAHEASLALQAIPANIFYVPAKLVVAAVGMVGGAIAGFVTGGNTRAAYGIWVPTTSGTFILTPAHLEGTRPIEFFGTDYGDQPSDRGAGAGRVVYDAVYDKTR